MILQNISNGAIKAVSNVCVRQKKRNGNKCTRRLYMALPRLTPQEVTTVLQTNEYTKEFNGQSSVKYYDSNQLPSNNPIEDARSEAQCLFTKGILLGVFDGHGGDACAQVISKRLFHYISACLLPKKLLKQYLNTVNSDNKLELLQMFNDRTEFISENKDLYQASFLSFMKDLADNECTTEFQMETALENAFMRLDNDLSNEALLNLGKKNTKKFLEIATSGAVAAVAHIDGPHLHVAGVGDCQAVLGTLSEEDGWSAKLMTVEHNTDNRAEVERILSEHPPNERSTIIKMERLLGQLAPLRSLGDFQYKWNKKTLREVAPYIGEAMIPPNYHTPPYLTAKPEVKYHRLTPRDKFLIIASDGLWDLISPLEGVRLVGEHMSGKVTLSSLRLPCRNMKLSDINKMLVQRKEGLKKKPLDSNAATHLLRHALGGTDYGIDHGKLSRLLTLSSPVVRIFRDDITITVVYMDSEYLRHCPP
ncbi:pyruvate dehydrogenase [acetyl-transferring]-phosphatase 1-like protein, mitochondrial [Nomia melanderi]|uniref:pyruvate dehydrogenase [acetyl-transferring]-phosphatase 1-like protein, mitochondrial n=1 Tax=Nomia melanderi TaxID=2448451 RepID=UPI00130419B7|nr:pyruvate dehydrogenase [acetyl-transferring]-phosphatase 1, mitochondrial [Nomia melanderi]XP_031840396.1 pyruvate dehydrogenase [acetyl-transferring]-phosphatase 1, mitochondrial [Nomia melanderi]XP_031840397.1 pyruvate dehydrogenase [acetyl-transferring]-phosphatase 1, mitochondrial [Nomia melanderi]XP_031840398.1 pyruvate dehydrogenase [acetyl-transferring]-phosphatase 1, mitochondrial [Nomia melanderi]XP_031840399.1 pyruvate dehydrogenase [acetyl-transferring]-phosphatase 1, mitochondria